MYKFLMYTLLQSNFTVLSTETIAEIGATITTRNEQFFKDNKVEALKLNTFFLDKQFQIKQRGENTCMVDFVWHNCKGKKGFQKYTYQKLYDEMEVYGSASFPMMSTQELIDWGKACHPNVSIHAYDSTWRKFMKHIASHGHSDVTLVFYIKDHHLYPIQDDRLKHIATKANQGGADNLWKCLIDIKWSNKSSNYIMYQDLVDNDIVAKRDKPTLSTIENHVIVLPSDTKIESVIEEYMMRTNYFVEYLHYDNNGRLDGFGDHKNNMYILNNEHENRKSICERLYKIYKSYDFIWCNQSYTSLSSSSFKHMRGYLPESQYDTKTREVLDFYPRALQWCSTDSAPDNLVSLDISKCYPSVLIDNESPILLYTIHDIIKPFGGVFRKGEYYIDEYVIDKRLGKGVKIEAGFYSEPLVRALITKFNMPTSNVKWCIQARKTLAPDTFKNYMLAIFSMFPESQAKLLQTVISPNWVGNIAARIMDLHVVHLIQLNASGHLLLLRIVML